MRETIIVSIINCIPELVAILVAILSAFIYKKLIPFINAKIDEKNIEKAHKNIMKAEDIILELRGTLEMKYPVAEEFDKVYDYIYRRLVEANMKKDKEILQDALKHIKTMRDTWKEVMRLNNVQ